MKFRSVTVCPIRSVEVGDLIAMEFLGSVISGKVTAVPYSAYDLTPELRVYMRKHNLTIPENKHAPLDSPGMRLIFGEFQGVHFLGADKEKHMYVDENTNVAVFPTHEGN